MDAIIRTYEHSLVKVTVFASHRSPSCASGFPASPPPSPTDDLKAPPVSPPRLSRASSSPLCPPSIYGGGPLSLSLGSFSERARTPPDDSEEMECVGGVWITPALALRRHRATLLSSCASHQTSAPPPDAARRDGDSPLPKRRRAA
eukprot:CAMPEP_0173432870 /NCGR_PEP_ID=MMETSP1357-20121228/10518_1 /TAXON_ID=77926 /ORGANISM="Hemiselmis rufescens, Strain PCC563" /LENGTH=145 /DNA_ID=CAMNT_0014397529 /DNA_START=484 /DNA_END=921 /DNA_ORIENTATION=+